MSKWILVCCLLCPFPAAAQEHHALAITHVTVIDCTGVAAKPDSTVIVEDGRINSVGPSDIAKIPEAARVLDAKDKFLIPGLWDMHGHLTDATEDAFPLLVMKGVTGCAIWGETSLKSTAGDQRLTTGCALVLTSFAPVLLLMDRNREYRID